MSAPPKGSAVRVRKLAADMTYREWLAGEIVASLSLTNDDKRVKARNAVDLADALIAALNGAVS